MPGVVVTTSTRSGPTAPLRATSGQFFVVGRSEWGDTNTPTLLRSANDVYEKLGNRPASDNEAWDALTLFFNEGGSQAYFVRIVGPGSSHASYTFKDTEDPAAEALLVTGKYAGSVGAQYSVGTEVDGTKMRVTVHYRGRVIEMSPWFTNLYDFENWESKHVTASAVGDNLNVGGQPRKIEVSAPKALAGGSDDYENVAADAHLDAMELFGAGLGDGAMYIPGVSTVGAPDQRVHSHLVKNNRILLVPTSGNQFVNVQNEATEFDSEYIGIFAPAVGRVSDAGGGTRLSGLVGYVAACRARAHNTVGPWRAPAGVIAASNTIVELAAEYTTEQIEVLDAARINPIRKVGNSYRLYNWRSTSTNVADYAYLKDRDTLNRIAVEAERRLEDYVFEAVDGKGQLLSQIRAELVGLAETYRAAGGLYEQYNENGEMIDPGFRVVVDSSNNTASSLASNVINAQLLVRIAPTGAFISIEIVKVGLLSSF